MLTDEQYRESGRTITNAMMEYLPCGIIWVHEGDGDERRALIAAGRTAYEAMRPLVLAEALDNTKNDNLNSEFDAVINTWVWSGVSLDKPKVIAMISEGIYIWASNRLRALTAPPVDPAVRAVKEECSKHGIVQGSFLERPELVRAFEAIVAAVRAADGKQAGNGR